MKWNRLKRKP